MYLNWSGDWPPVTSVDLKPQFTRNLDLVAVHEDGGVVINSPGWPPIGKEGFFLRGGRYRFTIVIGGEGSATLPPYRLNLDFAGDWQASTMEVIR